MVLYFERVVHAGEKFLQHCKGIVIYDTADIHILNSDLKCWV